MNYYIIDRRTGKIVHRLQAGTWQYARRAMESFPDAEFLIVDPSPSRYQLEEFAKVK